jgi:hypothetical protein
MPPGRTNSAERIEEAHMKYLLLIYADEQGFETMGDDERRAVYKEYDEFANDLASKGQMVGGDELAPTTSATTVRVRDGERMVTDGPFAETKEQLGGYFLVDVEDLDAAIEAASRIPTARAGSIEVRPIHDGG